MKLAVLGAGLVGAAIAKDLASMENYNVKVADISEDNLKKFDSVPSVQTIKTDLSVKENLEKITEDADLVVSAVPGFMGYKTLENLITLGKNVVDIAFFPEDPTPLENLAKENNVTAVFDCGVAPGMCHILTGYADYQLDETTDVEILVGGLPKERTKPFEYKAVFSPIDVIEEYTRPAKILQNGREVIKEALSELEEINFSKVGTLEAFISDGLRSLVKNINCPNMKEKTLRYPGHVEKVKMLRELGFFGQNEVQLNGYSIKPIDLTAKLLFPVWEFKEGDEDITIMKVSVTGLKNGKKLNYTYELYDEYDPETGIHSMARTTGFTATVVAKLILEKKYDKRGLIYPEFIGKDEESVRYILEELRKKRVFYKELITPVE